MVFQQVIGDRLQFRIRLDLVEAVEVFLVKPIELKKLRLAVLVCHACGAAIIIEEIVISIAKVVCYPCLSANLPGGSGEGAWVNVLTRPAGSLIEVRRFGSVG